MLDKKLILLGYFFLLVGCGSDEKAEAPVEENDQAVPSLNEMSIALTPLKAANPTDFEHHFKNGIYLNSTQNNGFLEAGNADTVNATESINNEGGQQANYSLTNEQEAGVAEGDRLKYDGEYMYIANDASYQQQDATLDTSNTSIRIVQRNAEGELSELSNTVVSEAASSINSLYLNEQTLAVLSNIYDYSIANSMLTSTVATDMFFPRELNFNLSLLDVSNQAVPQMTTSYTMDGAIIDSRRVDNVLYIVSSFSPYVAGLPFATTNAEKLENYQQVFASNINEFLPQLTDAAGNKSNLVEPENCYLPANSTDKDGFNGIVTLTTVDLTQPDSISSVCINTRVSGLYATPTSVYLYGTDYQYENEQATETSIIHKFSIAKQAIDYVASGTLEGRFNWGLSNLRFSEKDNNLRVVTTKGNQNVGYEHSLNILSPSGNQLKLIAQLPNDTYPDKIGKINDEGIVQEDIKAVRFFENKAFVVTFLETDPLYVLDLSDIEQLKIAGALEIPGYSSYLHPISDNLLVGIGQNVDPNRMVFIDAIAIDSAESIPIIEGAKISLFDVSNMNNPLEINSIVYQDGYTPVEYNYHALTYLKMPNGTHRFGLPVEKWLTETVVNLETGNEVDIWTRDNALQLIEVTGDDTDALLVDKGSVQAIRALEPSYISGWDDRAIFHGDDIYYLHGNNIWKSYWQTPELTTGPF